MLLVAWSTWNLNNAFTGRTDSSHEHCFYLQGDFLTGPPLKMSLDWPPQKNALTGPPHFEKVLSMASERGEIPNSLTFSIPRGGGPSLGL